MPTKHIIIFMSIMMFAHCSSQNKYSIKKIVLNQSPLYTEISDKNYNITFKLPPKWKLMHNKGSIWKAQYVSPKNDKSLRFRVIKTHKNKTLIDEIKRFIFAFKKKYLVHTDLSKIMNKMNPMDNDQSSFYGIDKGTRIYFDLGNASEKEYLVLLKKESMLYYFSFYGKLTKKMKRFDERHTFLRSLKFR